MKTTLKEIGFVLSLICFLAPSIIGQNAYVTNKGLEDQARMGSFVNIFSYTRPVSKWSDCGRIFFPKETPPDIHPSPDSSYWKNTTPPYEGNTYVGLVVRNNDTWESISQRIEGSLEQNKCYEWSIAISRSDSYWSRVRYVEDNQSDTEKNYTEPTVMRLWGGDSFCDKKELLAESTPIDHSKWRKYSFEVNPKNTHKYIIIEAFYKTPVWLPYNGHILIDDMSDFMQVDCETGAEKYPDKVIAEAPTPTKKPVETKVEEPDEEPIIGKQNNTGITQSPAPTIKPFKPKFIPELNRKTLEIGQTIRVKKLFFEADTSSLSEDSFPILDELTEFLLRNKDIYLEVGGHTNGLPPEDYCDSLSLKRAKLVSDYLVLNGIDLSRVVSKGYGKRKPIASNATQVGRNRNQRVEIKILKIGGKK